MISTIRYPSDMNTKHCNICNRTLSVDSFHKRSASIDGLAARCRGCQKIYDAGRLHKPERVALRAAYRVSEHGRERLTAGSYAWIERNPDKRQAHTITGNAIRDGRLVKQPCEVCGNPIVHAHHDDYTKPLDVRWLCVEHHTEHHSSMRMG